jgi:hypothetical protein
MWVRAKGKNPSFWQAIGKSRNSIFDLFSNTEGMQLQSRVGYGWAPVPMTPWSFQSNQWRHLTLIRQSCATGSIDCFSGNPKIWNVGSGSYRPFKAIQFYLDGALVKNISQSDLLRPGLYDSDDLIEIPFLDLRSEFGSDYSYKIAGGESAVDFAQIKYFNRALNASEVMTDCLSQASYLKDAACTLGVRGLAPAEFGIAASPQNNKQCRKQSISLVKLDGTVAAAGQTLNMTISADADLEIYQDANCTIPAQQIAFSSADTYRDLYFSTRTVGEKSFTMTASPNIVPPQTITVAVTGGVPTTFKLIGTRLSSVITSTGSYSPPVNCGTSHSQGFQIQLLDAEGNTTTSNTDLAMSWNWTSSLAAPLANGTAAFPSGSADLVFYLDSYSVHVGSSVTVAVSGLPSLTFTYKHPGSECGGD